MLEMNYFPLLLILGFTALVYALSWRVLQGGRERFFLGVILGGLCFYSGVGAAYTPVLWPYIWVYGTFVSIFGLIYLGVLKSTRSYAKRHGPAYLAMEVLMTKPPLVKAVIATYLFTSIAPLLYPEFRIHLLWNPPAPDLATVLNHGIAVEQPVLLKLNTYLATVLWPFYLVALYSIRRRYLLFALCIFAPAYARYCSVSYLGRGEMMMCLALFLGVVWLDRPEFRPRILLGTSIFIPVVLVIFGIYSHLRLGDFDAAASGPADQIRGLVQIETGFPRSWQALTASGQQADLPAYLKWLFTLPFPKLVTGEVAGARVNAEIAGIVTGIYPGEEEFSYTLTGPVIESVYIFGQSWFWVHAICIALLAALLCAFGGGCRSFLPVQVHLALLVGYNYGRAGIAGSAPYLINFYMSLYLLAFLFALVCRPVHHASQPGTA